MVGPAAGAGEARLYARQLHMQMGACPDYPFETVEETEMAGTPLRDWLTQSIARLPRGQGGHIHLVELSSGLDRPNWLLGTLSVLTDAWEIVEHRPDVRVAIGIA